MFQTLDGSYSRSGLCLQFGPRVSGDSFVLFSEGLRSQCDRGDSESCINRQEPQMINKNLPHRGCSHTFSLLQCITGLYRSMSGLCPCCRIGDTYSFRVDSWSHFVLPSASNRWRSSCVDRVKPTMEQRASTTQNMRKEKKSSLFHTA